VPSPVIPPDRGLVRSPGVRDFGALLENVGNEAAASFEARPVAPFSPPRKRDDLQSTPVNLSESSRPSHEHRIDFGSTRPGQSAHLMTLDVSGTHSAQRPSVVFAYRVGTPYVGLNRKPRRAPSGPDAPRRPPLAMDDLRPLPQAFSTEADLNSPASPTQSAETVDDSIADVSNDEEDDYLLPLSTTVTPRRPTRFATATRLSLEDLDCALHTASLAPYIFPRRPLRFTTRTRLSLEDLSCVLDTPDTNPASFTPQPAPPTPSASQTNPVSVQTHLSVSPTIVLNAGVISDPHGVTLSSSRSQMEEIFRDFLGLQVAATLADSLVVPDEPQNGDGDGVSVVEEHGNEAQVEEVPPSRTPNPYPFMHSSSPILTQATAFDNVQADDGNREGTTQAPTPTARNMLFQHIRRDGTHSSLRASGLGTVCNKLKKTRKVAGAGEEGTDTSTKGKGKGGFREWIRKVLGLGKGKGEE
jgi:hypothetical protein